MDEISDLVRVEENIIGQGGNDERGEVELVRELRENQIVYVDGVARVVVPMVAIGYPDDRVYVPGPVWMGEGDDSGEMDGGDSGYEQDMSSHGNEE